MIIDYVEKLEQFAREQGWETPSYEEVCVGTEWFKTIVVIDGKTYDYRGLYATYKEAKQEIAKTILEQFSQ